MSYLYSENDSNKSRILSALGHKEQAVGLSHVLRSYKDITLTAAQLDALNATPVELIPAPGAGKALIFEGAWCYLDYVSATYAGSSETIPIKYENGSGATVGTVLEAFIESTADAYCWVAPVTATALVNKALVATANADITTGDGILYMRVYYRVVTANLTGI